MEVHFDSQAFMRQRSGGISRLFADLISQFDDRPELGVKASIPFRWSNNAHVTADLSQRKLRKTPTWIPREALYATHFLRGSRIPSSAQIVHHTYYARRFLECPRSILRVTTVYDMIPELLAGKAHATGSHLNKREYVEKSDLVICISDSTRQDMEEIYGSIARQVVTIPLCVGSEFGPNKPPLPGLPRDYLLYVGKRAGYKDFETLIKAMQVLQSEGMDTPLVVVGSKFSSKESDEIRTRGLQSRVHQVSMDDHELSRAYANAALLVQTSIYEGFGLTPLEAMASGAPVVIANTSAMPEVGGDAASYFSAGDPDDLARAIARLITDNEEHHHLMQMGLRRAKLFTPQKLAERTAQEYRKLDLANYR